MLVTTDNLARSYNVTPFEIMAQDCDEVILFINYLLRKAEQTPSPAAPAKSEKQYIKVNDRTATGGWW
jgi:hypothetical protein